MSQTADAIARVLVHCHLFRELAPASLAMLSRSVVKRGLDAGEMLISRDDPADDVFLVASGLLRVMVYSANGRAVLLRDLGIGEVIGELAALDGGHRSASVEAKVASDVIRIPGATFRSLVAAEPSVAFAVAINCITLVRNLTDRLSELGSIDIPGRVQAEVLRLAADAPIVDGHHVIDPAPRHADIADRICARREAVSREMSKLARIGIVGRHGKMLVIKDLAALRALAHAASHT